MRKVEFNIVGGTAVRSVKHKLRKTGLPGLVLLLVLVMSSSAFAQGSIYGSVANSDLSTPANGEVTFIGFLDDTDEEIRIETSDGAGYDAGNWFDDFQNYLTEAPGNPYDYLFYNTANGEGYHLSGTIPDNSFQQEDVALSPISWPLVPAGLTAVTVSSSTVVVRWNGVAGLTYHVYRRAGTSNGSFFRIDNPAGPLSDPGVADSFFVDTSVDGVSSYDYLIIAEDISGNLSAHSAVFTVNSASIDPPVLTSIDPDSGTANGGTPVDIIGSGFDPAGADVFFGVTSVTGTVVSPFHLTATTPSGSVGTDVDVAVSNTAAGLSSNVLVGGYSYAPNSAPILASIGPQAITEGLPLVFGTSSSDTDGDTAIMTSSTLPGTAAYVDNGDGTGQFDWTPSYTDAGTYYVTFYATDALDAGLVDSEQVQITVTEAGNQPPTVNPVSDTSVAEGGTLALTITASDPDGETPGLSATGLPTNAGFTDNLDGTGDFSFSPDFTQAGVHNIVFKAVDAALEVDSIVVGITVTDVNQLPGLALIGPQNGTENVPLAFLVAATDPDGTVPVLTTSVLPGTAIFTDSLNGAGMFEWTPTYADSGTYLVTFYATDADYPADIDSEQVTITIAEAGNQAPILAAIDSQVVAEGGTLSLVITASDPDGTIPALTAENLPGNASFGDSLDGTGTFDFNPDYTQSGTYLVTFIASDGLLADSEIVEITVTEEGNLPPVIDSVGDFAVDEGDLLVIVVTASDPDGGGVSPILSVTTTLNNYIFVDSGNGTGTLTYNPDYYDAGIDTVHFFAIDFGVPQQSASMASEVTTNDINQAPVIDSIGPFAAVVDDSLVFTVSATDPTDPDTIHRLFLSAIGVPDNAAFTDNGDGTGLFEFLPDTSQAGLNSVTFLVVDQGTPQLSATLGVDINVVAENIPPVLDSIGPRVVVEGETLVINVTASDPDGPSPSIDTSRAPENCTFVDNGDGTAAFNFTPGYFGHTRLTSVTFRAYDGIALTKELVLIQIYDAGNQAPAFDSVPAPSVIEGSTLQQIVTAADPDGDSVVLAVDESVVSLPENAWFQDNGDGVGMISFSPNYCQSGLYDIYLVVLDGPPGDSATLSDTIVVTITVDEYGNLPPVLEPIGDQSVQETELLAITVVATDLDCTYPALTTSTLPPNASFADNGDGTGDFSFMPDYTQAGTHEITFYAADAEEIDSELVTITVDDMNQLPFVFTSGGRTIYEGDTLQYAVSSFDADGTTPYLSATLSGTTDSLAPNMLFDDPRDGTGTLTFIPDHTQGGTVSNPTSYNVVFIATDEDYPDVSQTSGTVSIDVIDRNWPPELVFPYGTGPYSANEGDSVVFEVYANDVDATTPPSLTALNMPSANATFDVVSGAGTFRFYPDFTQSGTYHVTFIALDDRGAADTQIVQIDIIEAGNQRPTFSNYIADDTLHVAVGQFYEIVVEPSDPDRDSVSIEAFPILENATWVDNGDGTGVYSFLADSAYLDSVIQITFVATDHPSLATDTLVTNTLIVSFLRGDLDNNMKYTMNDLAYLIGYLFRDGPAPEIGEAADVDGDGSVNVGDITYLIHYMYYFGPQPPR